MNTKKIAVIILSIMALALMIAAIAIAIQLANNQSPTDTSANIGDSCGQGFTTSTFCGGSYTDSDGIFKTCASNERLCTPVSGNDYKCAADSACPGGVSTPTPTSGGITPTATSQPTNNPTTNPTSNPTTNPTTNPTSVPSTNGPGTPTPNQTIVAHSCGQHCNQATGLCASGFTCAFNNPGCVTNGIYNNTTYCIPNSIYATSPRCNVPGVNTTDKYIVNSGGAVTDSYIQSLCVSYNPTNTPTPSGISAGGNLPSTAVVSEKLDPIILGLVLVIFGVSLYPKIKLRK